MNVQSPPSLKRFSFSPLLFAILLLAGQTGLWAQMPGATGGSGAMNTALIKLFGSNTAFTAHAEFRVLDKAGKETDTMPLGYTLLEGKTRMDVDMNQYRSAGMPAVFISTLKQLGMDQNVVITRPDKKVVFSIYPKAKSYAEIPMPKEDLVAVDKNFKVEKSSLGKETIDGHACEKNKVVLTGERGDKTEATVWNASDLKDFPVQIQLVDVDTTVIIKFKDVKLAKPDAKQFDAPAGLTKYDSAEALRDFLMFKIQGGASTNK